jgi:hypothetical protein
MDLSKTENQILVMHKDAHTKRYLASISMQAQLFHIITDRQNR